MRPFAHARCVRLHRLGSARRALLTCRYSHKICDSNLLNKHNFQHLDKKSGYSGMVNHNCSVPKCKPNSQKYRNTRYIRGREELVLYHFLLIQLASGGSGYNTHERTLPSPIDARSTETTPICLSVSRISQKVMDRVKQNLVGRLCVCV